MNLKTLLTAQITEVKTIQTDIANLQTELNKARESERFLELPQDSMDKTKKILADIKNKTTELDTLKRTIQQDIKSHCVVMFSDAQYIGTLSDAMSAKIASVNTMIENLNLSDLDRDLTNINKETNQINQELRQALYEKRKERQKDKTAKIQAILKDFASIKNSLAVANAKKDLAPMGLTAPNYTPEQEAIATQLASLINGLVFDEKQIALLQSKLENANRKMTTDLQVFNAKYNAKGNANALLSQLKPLANILGNSFGLEDAIKKLETSKDLGILAKANEEIQKNLATNNSGIRDALKQVAKEITTKYGFGITNADTITKLINTANATPEGLATALNTSIKELMDKKIITNATLHTSLSSKQQATLQTNYNTLNRANELAEKAVLTQAEREQLGRDIHNLQKIGQSKMAKKSSDMVTKLDKKTHVTKRVQRLKAKYGSFEAFQRSVDLNVLIEAHDISSLSTLTDEAKTKNITNQAAEALNARTMGNIKIQKQKEKAVYSRQVRRAMSKGDADAIKDLVQKRQDIIKSLETKLGVKGIKHAMKELRKVDKKIVGRKNAKAIYGDFGKNLKQIHLIGGTALTLPKYLVELTENLDLDTMAGISR